MPPNTYKEPDEMRLNETLLHLRYIGPYLHRRLRANGIRTGYDLIDTLDDLHNEGMVRSDVKQWLRYLLQNARAHQCVGPSVKINRGVICEYKVRDANEKAYNQIISFLQYWSPPHLRRLIPFKMRGNRVVNSTHPRTCRL